MKLLAHGTIAGERQWSIDTADSLKWLKNLPSDSVHLVITSPPYWALRCYGVDGQMGLEPTPESYIRAMTKVFREVRRVLRPDGCMFVNIGDTYAVGRGASGKYDPKQPARRQIKSRANDKPIAGIKNKDMIGIPWMLAFALRNDGWWLRQECIWHKSNAMPGSAKDRFSTDHEQIFLFTKSRKYYFDQVATSKPSATKTYTVTTTPRKDDTSSRGNKVNAFMEAKGGRYVSTTSNMRTVWRIATRKSKLKHFASFPPRLVEPMIRSSTSEHGCCSVCGKCVERIVKKTRVLTRPGRDTKVTKKGDTIWASKEDPTHDPVKLSQAKNTNKTEGNRDPQRHVTITETIGWKHCACLAPKTGCIVMDPFVGTGTVAQVALEHGQRFIGCDLNADYVAMANDRMAGVTPQLIVEGPAL